MNLTIGIYDFETDNRGWIHIYETRNERKYFDLINDSNVETEDVFNEKCKEWYLENILL